MAGEYYFSLWLGQEIENRSMHVKLLIQVKVFLLAATLFVPLESA